VSRLHPRITAKRTRAGQRTATPAKYFASRSARHDRLEASNGRHHDHCGEPREGHHHQVVEAAREEQA